MSIVENEVVVKELVTKSNLPASDYVINPYVGCPHGCRYCYACFMKRFTNHSGVVAVANHTVGYGGRQ